LLFLCNVIADENCWFEIAAKRRLMRGCAACLVGTNNPLNASFRKAISKGLLFLCNVMADENRWFEIAALTNDLGG